MRDHLLPERADIGATGFVRVDWSLAAVGSACGEEQQRQRLWKSGGNLIDSFRSNVRNWKSLGPEWSLLRRVLSPSYVPGTLEFGGPCSIQRGRSG